jgi:hypothetical protein
MKRTAPDKRLSSDPVMPHDATVRFHPLQVCRFDPCGFHDWDLMRVCPSGFHNCSHNVDFCCCADDAIMFMCKPWSAHASCAAVRVVLAADAVTVLVLVYELIYGHDDKQHDQLLKSGIRGNVHVLRG